MDVRTVVSDTLNIREGPSIKENYLGRLYFDEIVTVLFQTKNELNEIWYFIMSDKGCGWILSNFVGPVG